MKYYKCIYGNGWGNHFKENKIYKETTKIEVGYTLKEINKRGLFNEDFVEVPLIEYLKQEYSTGRMNYNDVINYVYKKELLLADAFNIFKNYNNNMEELKLEKSKVIETYNNGCSEVKKTLERLFGKEIFENKYLDLSKIRTKFEDSEFLLDKDGNYLLTNAGSGPYPKKSLCLNNSYNWELIYTDNKYYLLPTKN